MFLIGATRALLLAALLASCATTHLDVLTNADYQQIVGVVLAREQVRAPMTIFLGFNDAPAAPIAEGLKRAIPTGVLIKTSAADLRVAGLSGCDSDALSKAPALSLLFSAPELNADRVTFRVSFRACAMDQHSDFYTFTHVGNEWFLDQVQPDALE